MRRLFFFLCFALVFAFAYRLSRSIDTRDAYLRVCELTAKNFYDDSLKVRQWVKWCFSEALSWPRSARPADLVATVNDRMGELGVSHFAVYSPAEDTKLWTGRAEHTGLRTRYVDGHLMIYRVIDGSGAAKADVRKGDEIVKLPGIDEVSPAGATWREGDYVLNRGGREITRTITPGPVQMDGAPRVDALGGGIALLTIPNFRADYFERESLVKLTERLREFKSAIIDLRENGGGNLAAMMRTLSLFICDGREIGRLHRSARAGDVTADLKNQLGDAAQIAQLERASDLKLSAYFGYPCFNKPAVVLTGPETASVAEIFADAFLYRQNSKVWGWPTAGDVLLAVWYGLPSLGPGYSVSIPRAVYVDANGVVLEGRGVKPTRELHHDLAVARRGEDSWVNEAARALR